MTLLFPIDLKKKTVTVPFGTEDGVFHRGVDIEAEAGSPVLAPGEGIVTFCGLRGEYGFTVDIDHGNGCVSRLTHLTDVKLELNQRIFAGNVVGLLSADGAGDREKPLLHYECIMDGVPVDPAPHWSES